MKKTVISIDDLEIEQFNNLDKPSDLPVDKRYTGRTRQMNIRVTPSLYRAIRERALKEGLNISQTIEKAFNFYLKKN